MVDEVIFYKDMLYLVLESTLKEKILKVAHGAPLVGHLGFFKIQDLQVDEINVFLERPQG